MQQLVREATREKYLLDLVITDVEDAKHKVLPKITDHECVLVYFDLPVPETEAKQRLVWKYGDADWNGLRDELAKTDWSKLEACTVDQATEVLNDGILKTAQHTHTKTETANQEVNASLGQQQSG